MPIAENRLEILQVCKLLQCVREKDKEQIEKMTANGLPHLINYNDSTEGMTALSVAAIANDDNMIHFLLDLGAHPDVVDLKGRTAAMRAAEYGHVQCLEKLALAGANMRIMDLEGKGVIFYCISPTQRHSKCLEIAVLNGAEVNNVSKEGVPVFVVACESAVENEEMCEVLLKKGADPNKISEKNGRTALMAAASSGGIKVTRLILEAGGAVNAIDSRRNHAAHLAAKGGHLEVLALMAGYGAEFNQNDSANNNPVHIAAINGHGGCCKFLSQRGCNPKLKNTDGQLPKALAKDNNHKDALKECRKAEKSFGKVPKNGEPWAIHLYDWVQSRQQILEKMFKKFDPDKVGTVNAIDFEDSLTGMNVPLEEEELARIISLHDKSKDGKEDYNDFINGKKYLNKNYLMSAFEGKKKKKKKGGKKGKKKGKFKLVMPICTQEEGQRTYGGNPPEMFIERHINFTDTVRFGRDNPPTHPLQDDSAWYLQHPDKTFINVNEAAKMGDYDSLKNAFARGLPTDTRDKYYKTPLMVASADGRIDMVKYLLIHGANINSRDNFKWTPLHHACHAGQLDVIQLLIANGAEIDATSMNGGTPFTRAIESSKEDVVQCLMQSGAKLQTENKKGHNPTDIAASWADPRVYDLVTKKIEGLPQSKDGKKGKKGQGSGRAKSGRPTSAPGEPKDNVVTQSLNITRPKQEDYYSQRKGSILRAASALAGGLEEKEDITYTPLKAWTKQPSSKELILEREINRERFGWEVDFDDFEMPFKRNISKKLEMFGGLEEE